MPINQVDPEFNLEIEDDLEEQVNPKEKKKEERKNLLILIRGVPGSMKSTFGGILRAGFQRMGENAYHYEADEFFVSFDAKGNPSYTFDYKKLPEAHQLCQNRVQAVMGGGEKNIIVSNTFIYKTWMEPYRKLAKQFNYHVVELICNAGFPNVHGVPEEKVRKMRQNFEF